MKSIRGAIASIVLVLATVLTLAAPAGAATTYANCTQMHLKYKGGVGKVGAVDRRVNGGHARYAPYRSNTLYAANKLSDRDRDGIACEQ